LKGASPFPRHWVYDGAGRLFAKSATIDFEGWYRETGGERMPWRGRDAEPLAAEVESALERRLAGTVMRIESVRRLDLDAGETLTEQGARGTDVFLLLDGVLAVEVDEAVVAELGPGSIVGERAALEDGRRTATLRATTPCRAVVVPLDVLDEGDLGELAATRRRGDGS
jgi:hypothetical protein